MTESAQAPEMAHQEYCVGQEVRLHEGLTKVYMLYQRVGSSSNLEIEDPGLFECLQRGVTILELRPLPYPIADLRAEPHGACSTAIRVDLKAERRYCSLFFPVWQFDILP